VRRAVRRVLAAAGDRGASAVEYGLMVAAIAALIVGVLFALSGQFSDAMHDVCGHIEANNNETIQDSEAC
jgi:pilus assembly protein Flp/PilA